MYRPCMNCGVKMSECDIECSFKEKMEELKSYRDAEEQGLLIRLPCKVGDAVYVNKRCLRSLEGYGIHTKYVCGEVVATVKTKRQKLIKIRLLIHPNVKYHERFPFSSIGKTVFLTREEAEEALRKGAEHDG